MKIVLPCGFKINRADFLDNNGWIQQSSLFSQSKLCLHCEFNPDKENKVDTAKMLIENLSFTNGNAREEKVKKSDPCPKRRKSYERIKI